MELEKQSFMYTMVPTIVSDVIHCISYFNKHVSIALINNESHEFQNWCSTDIDETTVFV